MFTDPDWTERDVHMYERHGVTTAQADEALLDPQRVVIDPDYASQSGQSVRVIGFSESRRQVLTVILVKAEGRVYGGSGWPSNSKDRNLYYGKGANDEQDF